MYNFHNFHLFISLVLIDNVNLRKNQIFQLNSTFKLFCNQFYYMSFIAIFFDYVNFDSVLYNNT